MSAFIIYCGSLCAQASTTKQSPIIRHIFTKHTSITEHAPAETNILKTTQIKSHSVRPILDSAKKANEIPFFFYHKTTGIAGSLLSIGSDTLAGITTYWVDEFNEIYPNVNAQIQAIGSSSAPPALTEQTAQLGPMSRPMRFNEIEAFERQYGYPPTALRVAIDAIGIFVNQDNPIKGLNFKQLDAIFSATLRCQAPTFLHNWSSLGVKKLWAKRNIQRFGRTSISGTYGYFKKHALCGGDFNTQVNELPGSASVVQAVSSSIDGIGYSGISYRVAGVRLVPIALEGRNYISADRENIISGKYPLSRYLYVYINKHPDKQLSPLLSEFIRFIYSKQGQSLVAKDGYVPITPALARHELKKVGLWQKGN